jgi:hypothetical protein
MFLIILILIIKIFFYKLKKYYFNIFLNKRKSNRYLNLIPLEVSSWYEHGQARAGQAARKRRATERDFLYKLECSQGREEESSFPHGM